MSWVLDSAFSIHNTSASFMYDKYLYVGNEDFDIRVWNTERSSLFRKLPPDRTKQSGHMAQITGFAYSSRYDLLFSCGFDGCIITWHGTTMVHKFEYSKTKKSRFPIPIYSIYFNEENEILVIGLTGEIITFELSPTIMSQLVANNDNCPFIQRQSVKLHTDVIHRITGFQRRVFTCSYDRTVGTAQLLDLSVHKTLARLPTTPQSIVADVNSQSILVGDLTGSVKNFSVEGLFLGTIAEGLEEGVQCIYIDDAMQLIWIAARNGSIHVIDPKHPLQNIADNFQMFHDLPIVGSSKPRFEIIQGNGMLTRISAIVNTKYVYSWKWSSSAYLFKYSLKDYNIKHFTTFIYEDDSKESKPRRKKASVDSTPRVEKRVNSSIVSLGLNVFVGGENTILSLRPASDFLYQADALNEIGGSTCIDFSYQELCAYVGFENGNVMSICFSEIRNLVNPHVEGVKISDVYAIDSFCISVSEEDRSIVLWDAHNQLEQICKRERVHENELTATCVLTGAKEMYTCDELGFIRNWQITPTELKEVMLIDHRQFGPISYCVPSQMEDMLICATEDGFIRGWQRSNILGAPTFVFQVSPCYVTCLAATTYNDILVATDDKTIRLVSLSTKEEKAIYVGHTDLITKIVVPPKGDRWISMQWNSELYFWSHVRVTPSGRISAPPKDLSQTAARLPKLTNSRPPERAQSQLAQSQPNDQIISIYEKNRKALLLKRRDQERAARAERRTPLYHKILQLTAQVEKSIRDAEREKRRIDQQRSQQTPTHRRGQSVPPMH